MILDSSRIVSLNPSIKSSHLYLRMDHINWALKKPVIPNIQSDITVLTHLEYSRHGNERDTQFHREDGFILCCYWLILKYKYIDFL